MIMGSWGQLLTASVLWKDILTSIQYSSALSASYGIKLRKHGSLGHRHTMWATRWVQTQIGGLRLCLVSWEITERRLTFQTSKLSQPSKSRPGPRNVTDSDQKQMVSLVTAAKSLSYLIFLLEAFAARHMK